MNDVIEKLVKANVRPVDTPEREQRAHTATTTHVPAPGKSILIICCSQSCMEQMRMHALGRPWPMPVTMPTRYTLKCKGDTVQLMLKDQVETQGRALRHDEIYTCGDIYLPERLIHILSTRLLDPRGWPGYFSKFP